MNKPILLWLDDYRDPFEDDWLIFSPIGYNVEIVWCKTHLEFTHYIRTNGLPDGICFDHDLGDNYSGYDCAHWLVEYCMDNKKPLPKFASQSDNPPGRENILSLLRNYEKRENNS